MRKKNYSWLFFFFLSLSMVQGQVCLCDPQDAELSHYQWYTVAAPSGLILREGPGRNTAKLDAIPFGEEVFACRGTGIDDMIESKSGSWLKVTWANKIGYLFSGFLTKTNERKVRMIIPDTGFDSEWGCLDLPTEVKWQALVNTDTSTHGKAKPAIFVSTALKTGRKKVHPDCNEQGYLNNAVLNVSKSPFAVFSGFQLADNVVNLTPTPIALTPGAVFRLYNFGREDQLSKNYLIAVEGNVLTNTKFIKGGAESPIDRIEHYTIHFYQQTCNDSDTASEMPWNVQKLTDYTIFSPNGLDSENLGTQYIYFAGDLDGDHELDLILSHYGLGSAYHLYLSSKKIPGFLLRNVADWAEEND